MIINKRSGFSLLESVIGICGLLVLSLITNAYLMAFMKTNVTVKEVSQATAIGNTCMETFRTKPYTAINTGADTVDNKYLRTWTVNSLANRKEINLTVQWPVAPKTGAKIHSIQLSTIRAQ